MNSRYAEQFEPIPLTLEGDADAAVEASNFLLETAFWNIWTNAHQAVPSGITITLRMERSHDEVTVLVSDNGEGFPEGIRETAFQRQYSTKGEDRGRGLLEIQDAVERLGGSSSLVRDELGRLRLRLALPLWRTK